MKAENGSIKEYAITVDSLSKNNAINRIEITVYAPDGTSSVRKAVAQPSEPLKYNLKVDEAATGLDIKVVPQKRDVTEILIDGAYDSIEAASGARIRKDMGFDFDESE